MLYRKNLARKSNSNIEVTIIDEAELKIILYKINSIEILRV